MKIDLYNHVMPVRYLEMMQQHSQDQGIIKRMSGLRMLWDIEARVQMLDAQFPDVQQVLTLSLPAPELIGGPALAPELARLANDGMAAMVARWPQTFPAFIASLPMNNVPAALEEMDRAITTLGARGIQICTNVNGRPLDEPEFFPVFERVINTHDLPIFMHPARPVTRADYINEPTSKYEIWQVLGWPFETSVAMARMVFSGLFEKLPQLRLITHHCGAMLPYFAGRAETLWAQLGSRSVDEHYDELLKTMKKTPIEYFKMFHADTVLGGSASALRCGLDFFGVDRIVFASDCPFDLEGGPMFIREGIRSVEDLKLSDEEKRKIYCDNALRRYANTSSPWQHSVEIPIHLMGDTGLFGDMKLIADYYKPDLILMPIGGHFVMDPQDAAYATKEWLKPKFVIPMHYGTFPVLKGMPQEYMAALGQTSTKVFLINSGDKLEF